MRFSSPSSTDPVSRGRPTPGRISDLVATFDRLGHQVARSGPTSVMDAVAGAAVTQLPNTRSASITVLRHGRFTTAAATDEFARRADDLQYELGSGPCVDAIIEHTVFAPRNVRHDDRWPVYGKRVADELGVASMLSYRLTVEDDDMIAGLNVYSVVENAYDDDLTTGMLLAAHGALAVSAAGDRERAEGMRRSVASNREIGIAMGVLMQQHQLTRDQSFDLLRIASQT